MATSIQTTVDIRSHFLDTTAHLHPTQLQGPFMVPIQNIILISVNQVEAHADAFAFCVDAG